LLLSKENISAPLAPAMMSHVTNMISPAMSMAAATTAAHGMSCPRVFTSWPALALAGPLLPTAKSLSLPRPMGPVKPCMVVFPRLLRYFDDFWHCAGGENNAVGS
jgi:hypothetical protein